MSLESRTLGCWDLRLGIWYHVGTPRKPIIKTWDSWTWESGNLGLGTLRLCISRTLGLCLPLDRTGLVKSQKNFQNQPQYSYFLISH